MQRRTKEIKKMLEHDDIRVSNSTSMRLYIISTLAVRHYCWIPCFALPSLACLDQIYDGTYDVILDR